MCMLVWEKRHSQRLLLYKEKVQICITFMNEIRCGMPKVTAGERSHQSSGIATGTECGLSLSLVGSVLVYAADESRLFFAFLGCFFFFWSPSLLTEFPLIHISNCSFPNSCNGGLFSGKGRAIEKKNPQKQHFFLHVFECCRGPRVL